MNRNFGALVASAFAFAFVVYACTSGEVVQGPPSGTGNTTGSAGSTGAGNSVGSGGSTGAGNNTGRGGGGNQVGSGGSTGAGNSVGRGGSTGAGNSVGSGGSTGAGNSVGSGGSTGAGNSVGSGGSTGAGNSVGSGGSTGAGGSTASCPSTFSVSMNGFVQMPVTGGCFTGYPYTYADSTSTVMPAPMASFTTAMLKLTGTIAANAPPTYTYAGIGFSVAQSSGGEPPATVTPKGNGLVFNVTNSTSGTGVVVRAQVTDGTTPYCKDVTSFPATIAYTDFHATCYANPQGAAYSKTIPIKGIELNIAGGTAAGTINLQINSITEN